MMRLKADYSRYEESTSYQLVRILQSLVIDIQKSQILQGYFIIIPPSVLIVRMLMQMKPSQSYAVIILTMIMIVLSCLVLSCVV